MSRFSDWCRRSRICYRGAAAIDAADRELAAGVRETQAINGSEAAQEAVNALNEARRALARARSALAKQLKDSTLTAESREPSYWSNT